MSLLAISHAIALIVGYGVREGVRTWLRHKELRARRAAHKAGLSDPPSGFTDPTELDEKTDSKRRPR